MFSQKSKKHVLKQLQMCCVMYYYIIMQHVATLNALQLPSIKVGEPIAWVTYIHMYSQGLNKHVLKQPGAYIPLNQWYILNIPIPISTKSKNPPISAKYINSSYFHPIDVFFLNFFFLAPPILTMKHLCNMLYTCCVIYYIVMQHVITLNRIG